MQSAPKVHNCLEMSKNRENSLGFKKGTLKARILLICQKCLCKKLESLKCAPIIDAANAKCQDNSM